MTYKQAITSSDTAFWREAINNELGSILANHTWELVDLHQTTEAIGINWVFKKKLKPNGNIDKFKARLVALDNRQKKGIDYFDTYAFVTRIITPHIVLKG